MQNEDTMLKTLTASQVNVTRQRQSDMFQQWTPVVGEKCAGKNKRLDYDYRLCRMNTRTGPSIWMDDRLANEWIKQPHSDKTPDLIQA